MPAAVLVGGLIAIAFAFAAIAAALLVENLIVQPLQAAQVAVSETAVIGGILAWMLGVLVSAVRYSLAGVNALVGTAETQAADWWNFLVNQTVSSQFAWWFQQLWWLAGQEGWIAWLEAYMPGLYSFTVNSLAPTVAALSALASRTAGYVYGSLAPWVVQIDGRLSYVQSLVAGYLIPRVGAIGDDLAGLHRWIDANVATRSQVVQAEANAIARATAIAAPIAAAVTAIEDSPCMKVCDPLGDLGNLIQTLDDLGLMALVAALLEEATSDPVAVANVLRSDFVPLVHDAVGTFGVNV